MSAPPVERSSVAPQRGAEVGGAVPIAAVSRIGGRLFTKYVALFVAVVSIALLCNGAFEVFFYYREHKDALIRIQHEQAEAAAAKIGQFVKEIESQLGWTTQLPWSASSIEQRRFDALRLLRQVPAVTELAQVDASGKERLRVSRLAMDVIDSGIDLSADPKVTEAIAKKVYYGPVYFRRESEPYMTLSVAGTRKDAGVSIAEVNLKLIWDVVSQIKVGKAGHAYVVDPRGRLIAHPDISLVLRNTDMSNLPQVRAAQAGEYDRLQGSHNIQGQEVLTASAPIAPLGWTMLVELPVEEAYASLYAALERLALVLVGAMIFAVLAGMFLAKRMVGPIQALRAGAARIGGGEFGQRIDVKTGDELEGLADQFNEMGAKLQESYVNLEKKVEIRTAELSEALQQQTATADVLKVISRSAFDLDAVLNTLAQSAAELCGTSFGGIYLRDGDVLRLRGVSNLPPDQAAFVRSNVIPINEESYSGRAILFGEIGHIEDFTKDTQSRLRSNQEVIGFRTILHVPMMRDDVGIGMMVVWRLHVEKFTQRQIDLIKTFADQAVIAIENVRLFDEVQAKTRDVEESLRQQTATSDVLKIISRSAFDLETVFETLVRSASELCEADQGIIYVREGESFLAKAVFGVSNELRDYLRENPPRAGDGTVSGRVEASGKVEHIPDKWLDPGYNPPAQATALSDTRTLLGVPMLRDGRVEGVFTMMRIACRPFAQRQIDLVQTFADQAVIALGNVRLFDEVQAKTRDLAISLDQQTAIAEALALISRSGFDLRQVLDSLTKTAAKLCGADSGVLWLADNRDGALTVGSHVGYNEEFADEIRDMREAPDAGSPRVMSRAAALREPVVVKDILLDERFNGYEGHGLAGYRSVIAVPLLRDGVVLGVFSLDARAANRFAKPEIELLKTFADQAVIALANARLFEEVQAKTRDLSEALEQQTATSEVLAVISRSPSDLTPVLNAIAETAARLCGSQQTMFFRFDGEVFRILASWNFPIEVQQMLERRPVSPGHPSALGRAGASLSPAYIPDVLADPAYGLKIEQGRALYRATLAVPLLREGRLVGALSLNRSEPNAFTQKHIELVTTFADQAVIAIENVRLFDEVQAKTRDLSEALVYQTGSSNILRVIASSPTDVEPVLKAIVDSACELCDAADAAVLLRDGDSLRFSAHHGPIPIGIEKWPINRAWTAGRAVVDKKPVHVTDLQSAEGEEFPDGRELSLRMGHRSILSVPLLRDGESVGAIVLRRTEAVPFADKQIALLQTFADQAVIAIGNVRLFDEVQAKTRDLSEALEQQTATAEILNVIASSPTDMQPVFEAIARAAVRLIRCSTAYVMLLEGNALKPVAAIQAGGGQAQMSASMPLDATANFPSRVALEKKLMRIADFSTLDLPPHERMVHEKYGARSALILPMLREGACLGLLAMTDRSADHFTDNDIALAEIFCNQAVIGIENVRLFNETKESLTQQTATADVLKTISRSAFDLQNVLETLVTTAVDLIQAETGTICVRDGDVFRYRAFRSRRDELAHYLRDHPIEHPDRTTIAGRSILSGQIEEIPDALADAEFKVPMTSLGNPSRALIASPLIGNQGVEGALVLARREPGRYTNRQIDILKTFADQAVIAVENARLFEEVQARTRELSEALQQQTATADVLKVISRSVFDLDTVLRTLIDTAVRLGRGSRGTIFIRKNDLLVASAFHSNVSKEIRDFLTNSPWPIDGDSYMALAVRERRVVHVPDLMKSEHAGSVEIRKRAAFGAGLWVPLMRDGEAIGLFGVPRDEPVAFSDREIEIVKTFADQAVIAIENARLFDEVKARTRDLSEALEQQTATADVLKAISRSVFDLETVLRTLIDTAVRLCRGSRGTIFLRRGDMIEPAAFHTNVPANLRTFMLSTKFSIDDESFIADTIRSGHVVHLPDLVNEPTSLSDAAKAHARFGSMLCVPLMRQGEAIGCFAVPREEPLAYTPREIELVQTFADQAVIAIENARLFDEVQARTKELSESLQQQTATADVLKVISRSAFDLESVLSTLIRSAAELCSVDRGMIFVRNGDEHKLGAAFGLPPETETFFRRHPRRPGRESVVPRVLLSKAVEQIPDIHTDPEYALPSAANPVNNRAILGVPLLREGEVDGVFVLIRSEPGLFPDRQVELVETFADQAVIAIENARLFNELKTRTTELAKSLQDLRQAQDRLIQSEKLASLGQLTAGIAHEIKNPLNFVNNFSALSSELIDELLETLEPAPLDEKTREEVEDLAGMLKGNLEKVVQHGKRADSIVKNMLLHSREGSGEHRPSDINAIVEESLNLAYHGARAEKPGFNITLDRQFDAAAGLVDLYPQEMTRVLLNLISNGFYAAAKRKAETTEPFEPRLSAATRDRGDKVEIRIRDNGTGIPPDVKAKIFNPFFTTKPAGEGTGLGLSMSFDIVVKQHHGELAVETEPGAFTEFIITLPRDMTIPARSNA